MIEILLKLGPWLLTGVAALGAFFMHLSAKSKVADAQQKVAEAQTAAEQAKTQTAEVRDGEAQANATAARAGADASKERTNVENDVAVMPSGSAADELQDEWSRPGEDAGRGAVGAGQDANR